MPQTRNTALPCATSLRFPFVPIQSSTATTAINATTAATPMRCSRTTNGLRAAMGSRCCSVETDGKLGRRYPRRKTFRAAAAIAAAAAVTPSISGRPP